jgi:hypothetical protein
MVQKTVYLLATAHQFFPGNDNPYSTGIIRGPRA